MMRLAVKEYLDLRRALGFQLARHDVLLHDFVQFLESHGAATITTRLAVAWAKQHPKGHPGSWAQRLSVVRGFARHYSAIVPQTEVPPLGILPGRYPRKSPHIYTDGEIAGLLAAAAKLRPQRGIRSEDALTPLTFITLIGLLVVTGLRYSEVLNLRQDAVDLDGAILTVHRTKFGKTRLVPLHESTVAALCRYARQRDRLHPRPRVPHFFVGQHGGALDERGTKMTFIRLSKRIGLRGPSDRSGPRIHDFRHSFAVRTLREWYESGADVERQMPRLSTFLGHTHVADTYWYLSASPELLSLAGMRLEKFLEVLS